MVSHMIAVASNQTGRSHPPQQQDAAGASPASVVALAVPQQTLSVACPASMSACGDWPNVRLSARTA